MTRRPPGAVAAFSRSLRRDISDLTYLLTYLLKMFCLDHFLHKGFPREFLVLNEEND